MPGNAHAVIGANWGDEGKGLAVDATAARLASDVQAVTVVRSNGGAQAGHGVRRPDGAHHVFHHVGAGTFAGAATHLSQFFAAHPMMLMDELTTLDAQNYVPRRITIDPRAAVTTPWDMAINQALEMSRGITRHGSTGLGFGETIERQENGFPLTAGDLWRPGLRRTLARIAEEWVPLRLAALALEPQDTQLGAVFADTATLAARFFEDCAAFRARVSLADDATLGATGAVLFEGAQGLQLDMEFGEFPFVTRSHTGLRNMVAIAAEAGIGHLTATYITRAYATRHGAGPLPHEAPGPRGRGRIDWAEITDLTNAPNAWQGTIREAILDTDLMGATIACDITQADGMDIQIRPTLGVTCLDQLHGAARLYLSGAERRLLAKDVPASISEATGLELALTGHGPTRHSVRFPDPAHAVA